MEKTFFAGAQAYLKKLNDVFDEEKLNSVEVLAEALAEVWAAGGNVFICGNGGSAANAIHLANDLHYGIGTYEQLPGLLGMKVEALPANVGVLTCLANDTGYQNIYAQQLLVKGNKGDLLIALSGSGNSENIIRAIETGKNMGLRTCAITGYSGGKCKDISDISLHFPVNDMQIAEDIQLIVGHICMQWLSNRGLKKIA